MCLSVAAVVYYSALKLTFGVNINQCSDCSHFYWKEFRI